jgi:hypothetical protein
VFFFTRKSLQLVHCQLAESSMGLVEMTAALAFLQEAHFKADENVPNSVGSKHLATIEIC